MGNSTRRPKAGQRDGIKDEYGEGFHGAPILVSSGFHPKADQVEKYRRGVNRPALAGFSGLLAQRLSRKAEDA